LHARCKISDAVDEVGQGMLIDEQVLDHRAIHVPCLSSGVASAAPGEKIPLTNSDDQEKAT
jgi:hypothetical protein